MSERTDFLDFLAKFENPHEGKRIPGNFASIGPDFSLPALRAAPAGRQPEGPVQVGGGELGHHHRVRRCYLQNLGRQGTRDPPVSFPGLGAPGASWAGFCPPAGSCAGLWLPANVPHPARHVRALPPNSAWKSCSRGRGSHAIRPAGRRYAPLCTHAVGPGAVRARALHRRSARVPGAQRRGAAIWRRQQGVCGAPHRAATATASRRARLGTATQWHVAQN